MLERRTRCSGWFAPSAAKLDQFGPLRSKPVPGRIQRCRGQKKRPPAFAGDRLEEKNSHDKRHEPFGSRLWLRASDLLKIVEKRQLSQLCENCDKWRGS